MKELLLLVMLAVASLASAQTKFEVDGVSYKVTSSVAPLTVEVSSKSPVYTGSVTIPENVVNGGNTYTVTAVGYLAMSDGNLVSISLPNTVTKIDDYAFANCDDLASISLPEKLTYIGTWAFSRCTMLKSIVLPNSLITIADYGFYNCYGLTTIPIPNSVTEIGNSCFYDCFGLTSVVLPNQLTHIKPETFRRCEKLVSVTIPNSVTIIDKNAFEGCTMLQTVSIPDSATTIGDKAFSYCRNVVSIKVPNTVKSLGVRAFEGMDDLKSVIYPDSLTLVPDYCNYDNISLESVTLPGTVTKIGYCAYAGCTSIKSIYCYALTPPVLGQKAISAISSSAIIYVPAESLELYKNDINWNAFTIKEITAENSGIPADTAGTSGTVIVDYNVESPFGLYPNPAHNYIYVRSGNGELFYAAEIASVYGAVVYKTQITTGMETNMIDISVLPTGNYLINLFSNKGITVEQLVKE